MFAIHLDDVLFLFYVFFSETKLPCDYALSQCIKSADMCTQEYRDSLVNLTYQIEAAA